MSRAGDSWGCRSLAEMVAGLGDALRVEFVGPGPFFSWIASERLLRCGSFSEEIDQGEPEEGRAEFGRVNWFLASSRSSRFNAAWGILTPTSSETAPAETAPAETATGVNQHEVAVDS